MSIYDLPQFKVEKPKISSVRGLNIKSLSKQTLSIMVVSILAASFFGFLAGFISSTIFYAEIKGYLAEIPGLQKIIEKETVVETQYLPQTTQESAIIEAVEQVSPAVVSIIITKDLPIYEQYYISPFEDIFGEPFGFQIPQYRQKGTEKQEIGGGTGFLVSTDGMLLTNKHVVLDEEADYTILTNDGKKFPAKVLALDPFQDIAILKIETEQAINETGELIQKSFPVVKLGDSDQLQIGQTVVAIGNALGEYRNTVSVGVVSGLGRTITAASGDFVETIEDVIQTDAAINQGNSGGPLLNLKGEVVGINTATVLGAQSIGFAIPANKAKRDIEQLKTLGEIVYPYLGIYYTLITENLQQEFELKVGYGAWIGHDAQGQRIDEAVVPGTAAAKAGLQREDIILEFNGEKITTENSLAKIIQKYNPGDKITLKVLRGEKEINITVTLGEREE